MRPVRMMGVLTLGVALFATGVLAGCARPAAGEGPTAPETRSTSSTGAVRHDLNFINALRGRGVSVEPVGDVRQPFLRPVGTRLKLSGGVLATPAEIQSFGYEDASLGTDGVAALARDAAQFAPDGGIRGQQVDWIAPPHFYRAERLLVIYVGSDSAVTGLLSGLLGPQFAGR